MEGSQMGDEYPGGIPANPFFLPDEEALHRSEVIKRLAFDHLFPKTSLIHTYPFARSIVPIELVKKGDEQVLVHSRGIAVDRQPSSINLLADYPSVVSVVADRPISLTVPLPQLQELLVTSFTTVDQEALANLPGLISLNIGMGFGTRIVDLEELEAPGWQPEKLDLRILQRMTALRDLRFDTLAVSSLEPLRDLKGLERLRVTGYSPLKT